MTLETWRWNLPVWSNQAKEPLREHITCKWWPGTASWSARETISNLGLKKIIQGNTSSNRAVNDSRWKDNVLLKWGQSGKKNYYLLACCKKNVSISWPAKSVVISLPITNKFNCRRQEKPANLISFTRTRHVCSQLRLDFHAIWSDARLDLVSLLIWPRVFWLIQSTLKRLKQKRFDLRSFSHALCNLRLLLVYISEKRTSIAYLVSGL